MPWKMVFFLIVLALVVFFAGFNISNVSDISFGFYTVQNVPIFISLFVAFLVGTLVMLPFVTGKKQTKKKIGKAPNESQAPLPDLEAPSELANFDDSQSPRFKKGKKK
ncbi:MAG: hypothetical protein HN368_12660 [Spirochaetales bacterium]|jgi:uncharacterized integral membrane protein|nr:hypothetical protein [Spirochaetales bacterium]